MNVLFGVLLRGVTIGCDRCGLGLPRDRNMYATVVCPASARRCGDYPWLQHQRGAQRDEELA